MIVTDESGAVLPGADVRVTQTNTGLKRYGLTGTNGSFTIASVPVGPYRFEVMLQGFRSYVQPGIVLQVSSNPVINVTLTLGQVAETVTVQAHPSLVETRTMGVGQVMDNQRILDLPLNGRNPADLLRSCPPPCLSRY